MPRRSIVTPLLVAALVLSGATYGPAAAQEPGAHEAASTRAATVGAPTSSPTAQWQDVTIQAGSLRAASAFRQANRTGVVRSARWDGYRRFVASSKKPKPTAKPTSSPVATSSPTPTTSPTPATSPTATTTAPVATPTTAPAPTAAPIPSSPTPTVTQTAPVPTPTTQAPSPTATASPTATPTSSPSSTASPAPTPTAGPTASPTPTLTAGPSSAPTVSPTPTPSTRPALVAGADPVGSYSYPAPAGAYFVSPTGSDAATGSASAPWQTVAKAISAAPSGSTIVLRGGTYHESVTIPSGRRLTIQPHAKETVWFDGSRETSGWAADGSAWRLDGWVTNFDHSPTYTPGAPDNTQPGWSFVNANYPLAAWPEMVFVDGTPLTQVATREAVRSGTFFYNQAAAQLFIGDSPAGRSVRASRLQVGITVRGADSVLRGFGVRRYATSVPQKGAVLALAPRVTLENLTVVDNATQGMYVGGRGLGTDIVVNKVTLERNGLLGLESSYADRLQMTAVKANNNNTERFNTSPVSGGAKLTRARHITITRSALNNNDGPGLWLDESIFDAKVVSSDMIGNSRHGISFEISSDGLFVDNVIAKNGGNGMKMNNSSNLRIWNNTLVDNARQPLWLVQDSRVASDLSVPGHDPRQPLPDPTMTWLLGPATVRNNIFHRTSSNCLLCVQDSALRRTAAQIGVQADGNVYSRTSTTAPTWLIVWANGGTNPEAYTGLSGFRSTVKQESRGLEYSATAVVDAQYRPSAALKASQAASAYPLDADLAALAGRATDDKRLGAWTD